MLLFMDSFDHYDTAHMQLKWSFAAGITGGGSLPPNPTYINITNCGRNGTNGLSNATWGGIGLNIASYSTGLIFGFACQVSTLGTPIAFIGNEAGFSVEIFINSNGSVSCNGRVSAPNIVTEGIYHYYEVMVQLSGASTYGSMTLNFDGGSLLYAASTTLLAGPGSNTGVNSGYYFDTVLIGQTGEVGPLSTNFYDDIYIANTTAPNGTFLGDVNIVALLPSADGTVTGYTQVGGVSGEYFTSVNIVPPADDSDYVASATPGAVAHFKVPPPPGVLVNPLAAQIVAELRKETSGYRQYEIGWGNGTDSSDNFGPSGTLSTAYIYKLRELDINPITAEPFAIDDFNTAEIIIKTE